MERSVKGVCLDTNVLLTVLESDQNVVQELRERFGSKLEIATPTQVLNELSVLSAKNKKMEKKTRIAKQLLKVFEIKEKKVTAKNADDALEKLADEGYTIVTNDRELAKRIEKNKKSVWRLSNGKLIEA